MSKEKGQTMIGSASEDAFKDLQYQRLNNPTKKKKLLADTVICIPLSLALWSF